MRQIQVSCPPTLCPWTPIGAGCPPSTALWLVGLPWEPRGPAQRWPLWICSGRPLPSASQSLYSIFSGITCGGTPPHVVLSWLPLEGVRWAVCWPTSPPSPHVVRTPTFPLPPACHLPASLITPHGGEGSLGLGLPSPRPLTGVAKLCLPSPRAREGTVGAEGSLHACPRRIMTLFMGRVETWSGKQGKYFYENSSPRGQGLGGLAHSGPRGAPRT